MTKKMKERKVKPIPGHRCAGAYCFSSHKAEPEAKRAPVNINQKKLWGAMRLLGYMALVVVPAVVAVVAAVIWLVW